MNKNVFNGNYLQYNISKGLLKSIKSILYESRNGPLFLFNKDNKHVEVLEETLAENNPFKIPFGIFSNILLTLNCQIQDNNKIYDHPFKTKEYKLPFILNKLQTDVINIFGKYVDSISEKPLHITFNLPCGFGKTVISTYISLIYRLRTVVITHRLFLMPQWAKFFRLAGLNVYCSTKGPSYLSKLLNLDDDEIDDEIDDYSDCDDYNAREDYDSELKDEEILNDLKLQSDSNVYDSDVLIIPSKHLQNKKIRKYITNNYSICFIDESHTHNMLNNTVMTRFFSNYYFKYLFSLSATPSRINKLFFCQEIQLTESILDQLEAMKRLERKVFIVNSLVKNEIQLNQELFNFIQLFKNNKYKKQKFIYFNKLLVKDNYRNEIIIKNIMSTYKNNTRGIVLFTLKEHIEIVYNKLKENNLENVFLGSPDKITKIVDKIKADNIKKYLILSTDKLLNSGFDMNNLNTLHMVTVFQNESVCTQTCGRIERENLFFDEKTRFERYLYIYNFNSYCDKDIDIYFNYKLSGFFNKIYLSNWYKTTISY